MSAHRDKNHEAHILRPFCHLLSPAADRIKSRAVPVSNCDFDGRPRIPLSIAAMLAKTPNRKRAIELSEMEYPHWLMVAGAWLVVAGFIGLGISRYMNRAPAELHPAAPPNSSVAGTAEGEEMSARHSSAGLWKPADDDQLREMAASGKGPSAHGAHNRQPAVGFHTGSDLSKIVPHITAAEAARVDEIQGRTAARQS